MSIYDYQQAFAASDVTSTAMQKAIDSWFAAYYRAEVTQTADPCQRIAYTVVNKIMKAVFSEYKASAQDPAARKVLESLDACKKTAVQLALVGGECYLKPCPGAAGFSFTLLPRNRVLIFGRDDHGQPTDVGTVQTLTVGNAYYTLLERRRVDAMGYLTLENTLYRAKTANALGTQVPLHTVEAFADLPERYRFEEPIGSVGLVQLKTPMLNCVDGSPDGVAVYAAAMGLIGNIDANEAQLGGEFTRGQSRIIASRDLLGRDGTLQDNLFVGLDEDPEAVGITIFSPALRADAYLARKQEYLRNIESIIGMRRGMLSDANMEDKTATEITSTAGDFNLTVIDFQSMWHWAVGEALALCRQLARLYEMAPIRDTAFTLDWGNSTLYDEDKLWQDYQSMVAAGLLAPEVALGWRFNLPCDTQAQRQLIRQKLMP